MMAAVVDLCRSGGSSSRDACRTSAVPWPQVWLETKLLPGECHLVEAITRSVAAPTSRSPLVPRDPRPLLRACYLHRQHLPKAPSSTPTQIRSAMLVTLAPHLTFSR